MAKTILYKVLGVGAMPDNYRREVEQEGVVLWDEGIRSSVTYRNFRGGGRYANWKRQWFSASIALTGTRFLALRLKTPVIDIPLNDERFREMNFSAESVETLLAVFNANLFHSDWSGIIEYRFRTPLAPKFLAEIKARQR